MDAAEEDEDAFKAGAWTCKEILTLINTLFSMIEHMLKLDKIGASQRYPMWEQPYSDVSTCCNHQIPGPSLKCPTFHLIAYRSHTGPFVDFQRLVTGHNIASSCRRPSKICEWSARGSKIDWWPWPRCGVHWVGILASNFRLYQKGGGILFCLKHGFPVLLASWEA